MSYIFRDDLNSYSVILCDDMVKIRSKSTNKGCFKSSGENFLSAWQKLFQEGNGTSSIMN